MGRLTDMKRKAYPIALSGVLGALALTLSYIEGLIPPLPMMPPGAKPGLSNIVVMFAASHLGLPYALFIALIKGAFALFTRGAVAGCMSLAGGLLSAFVGWFILRKTNLSFITTGVLCALSHNAGQLFVASFITGKTILYYAPMLVFFGVCSGVATGLLLYFFTRAAAKTLTHIKIQ